MDMDKLFRGVLKRIYKKYEVYCLKGYVHVREIWKKCDGCVNHLGVLLS